MAAGEDEAIAVKPRGVLGVVLKEVGIEHCADLR